MPPRAKNAFGTEILKGILVAAILGTAAAALDTWVTVKLQAREIAELRKDVDRLWSETSDQVAALQGFHPSDTRLADVRTSIHKLEPAAAAAAMAEAAPHP